MPMRTHTCGELTKDNEGVTVALCGWAANLRDHGGVLFIDLRDKYGHTQVTFNPVLNSELYQKARKITPESAILVTGIVRKRPQEAVKDYSTGEIEVEAKELKIFSISDPLPFQLSEADSVEVTKRLKYRYMDIRRHNIQSCLQFRYRVIKEIRDFFDEQGFIEVETPYLTKSTPEGAR
ncbi:MAG: amino acid--tRNA ligase-related protein, partial [Planctomycetota bacterium]